MEITAEKLKRFLSGQESFEVGEPAKCWYDGEICAFHTESHGLLNVTKSHCTFCGKVDWAQVLSIIIEMAKAHKPLKDMVVEKILEEDIGGVEKITVDCLLNESLGQMTDITEEAHEFVQNGIDSLVKLLQLKEISVWREAEE